jgi:phosphotransferase system  glucose/maltose/N-acetylglucosamine-specific IIC component
MKDALGNVKWWLWVGCTAVYALVAYLLADNAWSPAVFNALHPSHTSMILAGVITMPVSLLALPVTYILAAVLIRDMGVGSVTSQVGHTMGLWFAVLAVLNVIAITFLFRVLRHEREKSAARKAAKAESSEQVSPYAT